MVKFLYQFLINTNIKKHLPNLDLRTNEDYLHLSANFKDLYELIPEYMYLILNAHKRLQQLLCKYYKNIVSTEKRYLLCRNIYSGDKYKKTYLHIVYKDVKMC